MKRPKFSAKTAKHTHFTLTHARSEEEREKERGDTPCQKLRQIIVASLNKKEGMSV